MGRNFCKDMTKWDTGGEELAINRQGDFICSGVHR